MKNINLFRNSSRLAKQMVLYIVLASTFIAIFTSAFQLYEEYKTEVSGIELRLNEIRDSSLDTIASRVWVSNAEELEKTLLGILSLPDIEYIKVYEESALLTEVGQLPTSDTININFPLLYTFRGDERKIGSIYITASLENVYQHLLDQALTIIVSNAIKTFIVSGFMLFLFYGLIIRHLHRIAEYAGNININNLGQRLVLERSENDSRHKDEFDVLTDALHSMQLNLHNSVVSLAESEKNLSQTLDCIGDAVIATDKNGCITRMNPVSEKLSGWIFSDAEGKLLTEVFNIYNAVTGEPVNNPVQRVLETGKIVGLANHTVLVAKGGMEYQIADSAAPILNEENEIYGVILVFRDVTEEYILQEVMMKNEQRLQALMDNSASVIYIKDLDGKFILVNRQFEKILDLKNEDVIGKTTHDLFIEEIADEMVANDQDVLGSRLALHSEEKMLQDDGLHIYASDKFCLFDADGEPYAVGGISTDITEKIKQNELLRRSQKMEALGKLTGGIAHDFNNMLNVIIGYAEILRLNLADDSSNANFAREIQNAGKRGAALTRKLLSFSGQTSSEESIVNINSILNDDINMLSKTMTAKIHVSMELADELWPTLLDKGELEDAILNLSINAMHAMPNGGKVKYLTLNESLDALAADKIGLSGSGDYVRLSIIDTGMGMSQDIMNKVFDPFFSTKGDQGTGLGLSQVYGFMERCNGAITVHSEMGNGTEFSMYFPRAQAEVVGTEKQQVDNDDNSLFDGVETILLVEDEIPLLEWMKNIFNKKGYKVYCADGADSALWFLSRNKVDIMVSDVIMPGTSGFELAKQVEDLYPEIKIQLVSGFAGEHNEIDKNSPYIKTLINKPYTADELLQRVRELLGGVIS